MAPFSFFRLSRLYLGVLWFGLFAAACSGGTTQDGGIPCTQDEECGIGEYCNNGFCTPFGGDKGPQSCVADNECQDGEICLQGICTPGTRDGGEDGSDGSGDQTQDGGDGDGAVLPTPRITLAGDVTTHEDEHGKIYEINYGSVTIGTPVDRNLIVRNTGDADLVVSVVTLTDDPQDEFSILPGVPPELTLGPGEEDTLVITYEASDGLTDRSVAKVFSNDPEEGEIDVNLVSEFKGEARIFLDPVGLDFGSVPQGQNTTRTLTISNQGTGNAVLQIDSVEPEAGIAAAYQVALEDPDGVGLSTPAYINKGEFILAQVTFLAPGRGTYDGNLIIVSSDELASPTTVPMQASAGLPIIRVDPELIDFENVAVNDSATIVLTIRNDGVGDLSVFSLDLAGAGSPDFGLEDVPAPLPAQPLVLAPASENTVTVRYSPAEEANDMSTLLIGHDDPEPGRELQVLVQGNGFIGNEPPIAVIKANNQDTARLDILFGTQVVLDGRDSTDDGTVEGYLWELIEQPSVPKCGQPFTLSGIYNDVTSLIPTEAGLTRIGLIVTDNDGDDSAQDVLDIVVHAEPEARIKEGGNDTGFVAVDMGTEVTFDAILSTDCDGAVTDWQWEILSFPPGRGAAPNIGGGDLYATVNFDFPGDYVIGLTVEDNDVPANQSSQATFDVHVRGPKAFRVTLDWFDQGDSDRAVDVDLHLLRPGSTDLCHWNDDSCSPDDCCPAKGGVDGCAEDVDWGVHGSPVYQVDNYEDPDGAVWPPDPGNFGDEISMIGPGMGNFDLYVYFRCHSSADDAIYICCEDFPPFICAISPFCADGVCDRAASGVVRFFVTGDDDQEIEVTQKTFGFTHGQVKTFFQIGTISWPNGTLQ